MTRRAFPYTPFDPLVQNDTRPRLPMNSPDLNYRNHYKEGTRVGELGNTKGQLGVVVPIESIFTSGPETARGASRRLTGGVVRGYMRENSIRPSILVSLNLKSPTSHPIDANRLAASGRIPPVNTVPSKDRGMPPKMGKRGTGGNFTIPNPQVVPSWPTSVDWLRSRFG
jgi:hypothetical protein